MDDSDDDETFVTIGNALPPFEEDEVPSKPVPLHDQVVKDSEGRVRFHGAFTGGFSAGYYNTVGSAEGWTPTSFVSSRQQRADNARQAPEDFMDKEDLGEFGIAPRLVSTTDKFTSAERQRKRQVDSSGNDIILQELVLPSSVPMGIRLLRKLGWKEGQGVGPRVKRKSRHRTTDGKKMYGCAMPSDGSDGNQSEISDGEGYGDDVTFAPKDVTPINFQSKDDLHGIGYRGIDPRTAMGHVTLFEDPQAPGFGRKKGIRGHAFGTGALEDEDVDIYGMDHLSRYDRELPTLSEEVSKHGTLENKHSAKQSKTQNEVVKGFLRSSNQVKPKKVYLPPQLPRDFRPHHIFPRTAQDCIPVSAQTDPVGTGNKTKMDASQRREILGEKPEIKSVMDLISEADKSRLANLQKPMAQETTSDSTPTTNTTPTASPAPVKTAVPPGLIAALMDASPTAAQGKLGQFKPFAKEPEKQARYEMYLQQTKPGHTPSAVSQPAGQHDSRTEWAIEKEREEFSRAAALYRPLSSMMANRFTTAKFADEDNQVEMPAEPGGDITDQKKAATMKMFGQLTRDRFEWHPDRLLCKRFNIPHPYPDSTTVGLPSVKKDKFSVFNFLNFAGTRETEATEEKPKSEEKDMSSKSTKGQGSKSKLKPLAILATVDLQTQPIGTATGGEKAKVSLEQSSTSDKTETPPDEGPPTERPSMDLFKAIFADSDSSSDDNDDESDAAEENNQSHIKPPLSNPSLASIPHPHHAALSNPPDDVSNQKTEDTNANNTTVGRHRFETPFPTSNPVNIFSHLMMESKPRLQDKPIPTITSNDSGVKLGGVGSCITVSDDEETFGPAPPPKLPAAHSSSYTSGSSSKKHKKKDSHKSKHKNKKHKYKSKNHKSEKNKKLKKSKKKKKKSSSSDPEYISSS